MQPGSDVVAALPRSGALAPLQAAVDGLRPGDHWGRDAADLLLREGFARGFSDLHLSPTGTGLSIRGRREGVLVRLAEVEGTERAALLIARFKVMARVPSYVRHEPQDGRIDLEREGGAPVATLRAAFLPTVQGESLVLRFPVDAGPLERLESLGMPDGVLREVERALGGGEGCLVVTGPSGSGKTTTLYAMLARLEAALSDRLQMVSIEDPVERKLPFVRQVQVNDALGVTFDSILRAALRHDPDVLLVGEVRDAATARTAIQAGTSGHLVLTTLHAGRALRVVPRLISMGVEPYLAAASLQAVLAQRLVRLRCTECGATASPSCTRCGGSGIAGRRALFELLPFDEELRELILARPGSAEFERHGRSRLVGDIEADAQTMAREGRIAPLDAELISGTETPSASPGGETP